MNVGILTFHRSRNYGAVLQAYGLCYTVNKLGHSCRVIDYKCPKIEEDLIKSTQSRNPVTKILKMIFAKYKEVTFSRFNRQYLGITGKNIGNIEDELTKYDAIIVGSDQIWNSNITGDDHIYYLENYTGTKIAYAASTGDDTASIESRLDRLAGFKSISVREEILHKVMHDNGINSLVVCDPTILSGRDVFEAIANKKRLGRKYLFLFMIWESASLRKNAELYAKKHGLELISNKKCLKFMLHSTPTDFISWIANAECVFTNSFHGTVFSLLFHKTFMSSIVKPKGKTNRRIEQLLDRIGCGRNIICNENENVVKIPELNYTNIDVELGQMKNEGMCFLRTTLEK